MSPASGAPASMGQLMVKMGDDPRVIPLPQEPITVGRSSQNAIAIMDSSLSRVHCEFRRVDGTVMVRDLGSRNGTLVNGQGVREQKLQSGDKVDVGICRITVWFEKSEIKLEVSAGKTGERKSDAPDTKSAKPESDTRARVTLPAAGAPQDAAAWGKRSSSSGALAVAGLVGLFSVVVVAGLMLKSRSKTGPKAIVDPWKTMDYADAAALKAQWTAPKGSPADIALGAGREGPGLELTRRAGARGLAEAEGKTFEVGAKKAYRLSGWCRVTGGHAGLRLGWIAAGADQPFAWSGTGLSEAEGERGGAWFAPEGAVEARVACVVAGEGAKAVFDDLDFAEAEPDRPPVAGRTVQAAFEAPGVFYLAARGGAPLRASVGLDGSDATCAIGAKRTAKGGTFTLPDPSGKAPVEVTEERDGEGEGFLVRYASKGEGLRLAFATDAVEVDGRTPAEFVRTARAVVGPSGSRVAMELRPDAEVGIEDGRVVVRFPSDTFEIAFHPETGGGATSAALTEAAKAEQARQFGRALSLYEEAVAKNPKGDVALEADARAAALREMAEDALKRARKRRADSEFTGKPAGCDEAAVEYLALERDFDGTEYAAQARGEREITELLRKQLAGELVEAEVGRLLRMAEAYFSEGRLALARAYCEAVQDRTTDPDAAARADSLLQRIDSKERE